MVALARSRLDFGHAAEQLKIARVGDDTLKR